MLLRVDFTGDTGKATATAGTPIKSLIPPRRGHRTRIPTLRYTTGANAHVLTVMRALANTKLTANALAGQAVIVLAVDPGTLLTPSRPLAVNDWVVVEGPALNNLPTFILAQVSAVAAGTVAGTLNVTLTANLPTGGVAKNAVVWMLGVTTDGHPQFTLPASVTTLLQDIAVGFVGSRGNYEPLLLWADNVTAAGTLENASVAYTQEGGGGIGVGGAASLRGDMNEGSSEQLPEAGVSVMLLTPDERKSTREAMGQHEHWQDPAWDNAGEDPLYFEGEPGDPNFKGEGQPSQAVQGGQPPEQVVPPPSPTPNPGAVDPGQSAPPAPPTQTPISTGGIDPGQTAPPPAAPGTPQPVPGAVDPGAAG